jgi:hypothetical protein
MDEARAGLDCWAAALTRNRDERSVAAQKKTIPFGADRQLEDRRSDLDHRLHHAQPRHMV